jgi:hypothetical protein
VHAVVRFEPADGGKWLEQPVSYHVTQASAEEDAEERGGPAGEETAGFHVGVATLLEAWQHGAFSLEEVRARLRVEFGPLDEEETVRAARTRIWTVWYEDRFNYGPDRDPAFPVGHFFSAEDAEQDAGKRGGRGEYDGHEASGGVSLLEALRTGVVERTGEARRLLERARPLEQAMWRRVQDFVAREVTRGTSELPQHATLRGDLGITGREGARVMAAFFTEFGVNADEFVVTAHFAPEKIGVLGTISSLMQGGPPSRDISLDDLLTAAMLGQWLAEPAA